MQINFRLLREAHAFLLPPQRKQKHIRFAIASEFTRIDGRASPDALVGMGGAITNIAAVKHQMAKYDPDVIQGSVIERTEVERQIELYRSKTTDERRAIVGLQPKRADVILAGVCIVKIVMDKLAKDKLSVSDRGLRHGVLIDRFAGGLGSSESTIPPR